MPQTVPWLLQRSTVCGTEMEYAKLPDVSGYRLKKAVKLLASLGYHKVDVQLAASPRTRQAGYDNNSRVVRQSILPDDTIVLLVCNIASASKGDIPFKGI